MITTEAMRRAIGWPWHIRVAHAAACGYETRPEFEPPHPMTEPDVSIRDLGPCAPKDWADLFERP
jgi:hypothetical protein